MRALHVFVEQRVCEPHGHSQTNNEQRYISYALRVLENLLGASDQCCSWSLSVRLGGVIGIGLRASPVVTPVSWVARVVTISWPVTPIGPLGVPGWCCRGFLIMRWGWMIGIGLRTSPVVLPVSWVARVVTISWSSVPATLSGPFPPRRVITLSWW